MSLLYTCNNDRFLRIHVDTAGLSPFPPTRRQQHDAICQRSYYLQNHRVSPIYDVAEAEGSGPIFVLLALENAPSVATGRRRPLISTSNVQVIETVFLLAEERILMLWAVHLHGIRRGISLAIFRLISMLQSIHVMGMSLTRFLPILPAKKQASGMPAVEK